MTTKLHHCATQVVHWLMAAGLPLETLTKKIAILGMLSYLKITGVIYVICLMKLCNLSCIHDS